jgi:hypothetical protein
MNAARPPSPSAPPPPAPPMTSAAAARGAERLSAAELAALRPHVISLEDGRLAAGAPKAAANVAEFRTTAADLDAIFSEHLPAFVAEHAPGPVPVVLYAHGGLVDKEAGFGIAEHQVVWWKENGVYPIHFIWETGLGTALWDALRRWASGGRRGWADEAKDSFLEVAARLLGGGGIWNDMKVDAAAASVEGGGALAFATALAKWMRKNRGAITVHAVGHSAGSIFHSHFVPAAIASGVPSVESVNLLAPAVRIDTFSKLLLPLAKKGKVKRIAIFTMDDEAERDDTCLRIYNKSLLYLVSASFEPRKATPILGMAKYLAVDANVGPYFTGSSPSGDLVLAPHAVGRRAGSAARAHGAFDGDAATMESVARRVAGVSDITPFPAGRGRGTEPWPGFEDLPAAGAARSTDATPAAGARRALCIGVDAYPDAGDRLAGCVADARAWGEAFRDAGFEVQELTDAAATRDEILRGILELVSGAAPGDVLAVQYSGHGTFVPDLDADEDDGDVAKDEALCPVDFRQEGRLIIDDDLARIWDVIPEGVSLTCFFDSCHSGSANRAPDVDLTRLDDSRPRVVSLSRRDEEAYRADRGVAAKPGATDPIRDAAVASVLDSEETLPAVPRAAGVRREVLFSACKATEVAWESGGQGDFTRNAIPLLTTGIGRVANRDFVRSVVTAFGDNRRQTPEFHGEEVLGGRVLLGMATEQAKPGDTAVVPAASGATSVSGELSAMVAAASDDGRAAAIAAFLRATADLLES